MHTKYNLISTVLTADLSTDIVRALVEHGAVITAPYNNPLRSAIDLCYADMVDTLLKLGANPNIVILLDKDSIQSPLAYAIAKCNEDVVRQLLKHGANPNQLLRGDMMYPLMHTLYYVQQTGNTGVLAALLEYGAIVNAANLIGNTALFYAAEYGMLSTIDLLLENNADKHITNIFGDTALTNLIPSRLPIHEYDESRQPLTTAYIPIIESFLAAGFDINATNYTGQTLLMKMIITMAVHGEAMESHSVEMFDYLLDHGADVRVLNHNMDTALHYASALLNMTSRENQVHILHRLLDKGADVNAINAYATTPLYMAITGGNTIIVETLLNAGADANIYIYTSNTSDYFGRRARWKICRTNCAAYH